MKALIVNCSSSHYNLGAHKLSAWLTEQGHQVEYWDGDPGFFAIGYDLVALSVIFSWHVPVAQQIALRVKGSSEVWAGGPGLTRLAGWWKRKTGLDCHVGLDDRFERQRVPNAHMTFASRGCPVGCDFCVVPEIEGREQTLYWDFQPAPVLSDNNLSALPAKFQQHIVNRYKQTGVCLLDAQNGFEPRSFDDDTYHRWIPLMRRSVAWRFGYDTTDEGERVERMAKLLVGYGVRSRLIQVYVLIGLEPVAACYRRCLQVIEWGGEPFVQPYRPLDALRYDQFDCQHDWTPETLTAFARFFNRHNWRRFPLHDYVHRGKRIFRDVI